MKLIKSLLIIVLVLTIAGGGVYYAVLRTRPSNLPPQLQVLVPFIQAGMERISSNFPNGIQLSQIAQMGSVLGISTEVKPEVKKDGPSLPQQAMETARYTYCQQVIKDYQQRYGTASASASPKPPEHSGSPKPSASPRPNTEGTNKPASPLPSGNPKLQTNTGNAK